MRAAYIFSVLIALALPGLSGCDSDCERPSRLDGKYAVWSNVITHDPEVIPDDYPSREIFYNGWSSWDLRYISAQSSFELAVDDQPTYAGAYQSSDNNCNSFTLSFEGIYVDDTGCMHDFTWTGELSYYGSHLAGTWDYSSDWNDPITGGNGQVQAHGQLTGTKIYGSYDTGFTVF